MDHMHSNGSSTAQTTCPMIMVFHGGHCERILWRSWVASTYVEFTFSCLAFVLMGFLYEALKCLRQHLIKRAVRKEAERIILDLNQLNQSTDTCSSGTPRELGFTSTIALTDIRVTSKTSSQFLTISTHIITTLIFFAQVVLSYLLMLVFMNYNYWLCLSVVLGLGLGYFFFGWSQHDAYEVDCCH